MLEDLSGAAVRGYRAPSFSITEWAIPVLREEGFDYDSSVFATAVNSRYGQLPGIDARETVVELAPGFYEVGVSCLALGSRGLPWGGGGYFRLLPYPVFRRGIDHVRRTRPYVFYLHPWEIDPGQPRPAGVPLAYRFRHYVGLRRCEQRFEALLRDFPWSPISRLVELARESEEVRAA